MKTLAFPLLLGLVAFGVAPGCSSSNPPGTSSPPGTPGKGQDAGTYGTTSSSGSGSSSSGGSTGDDDAAAADDEAATSDDAAAQTLDDAASGSDDAAAQDSPTPSESDASSTGDGEPCGSLNCGSGCCDSTGTCQPGTAASACGQEGFACEACSDGQACTGNACVATGGSDGGDTCAQKSCGSDLECWAQGCLTTCKLVPAKLTDFGYCE